MQKNGHCCFQLLLFQNDNNLLGFFWCWFRECYMRISFSCYAQKFLSVEWGGCHSKTFSTPLWDFEHVLMTARDFISHDSFMKVMFVQVLQSRTVQHHSRDIRLSAKSVFHSQTVVLICLSLPGGFLYPSTST